MKGIDTRDSISDESQMVDIVSVIPVGNVLPELVASHLSPNIKELEWNWRC